MLRLLHAVLIADNKSIIYNEIAILHSTRITLQKLNSPTTQLGEGFTLHNAGETCCVGVQPPAVMLYAHYLMSFLHSSIWKLNSLKAWDYFITHKLSTTDRILLNVYSQPPLITSCICTYFISSVPYSSDKELFGQPIGEAIPLPRNFLIF